MRVIGVNLQRHPSSDEHQSLDRLTEVELQALYLLAEGHTVKSIATQTGQSVGTINERLRQARRKTGAISSRELARLVKAQKVGNDKIGMAPGAALVDPSPAQRRGGGKKAMAIILSSGAIALTIASIFALQPSETPDNQSQSAESDEIMGSVVEGSSGRQPLDLYYRVRSEARDEAWASDTETKLKLRYMQIAHVAGPQGVRVLCRTNLCEVAGWIDLPDPKTKAEIAEINSVMQALQGPAVKEDLAALGLESSAAAFGGGSRLRPDRSTFAMYWRRKPSLYQVGRTAPADDLLGPLVSGSTGVDLETLHATVRSEGRDGSWAPRMETALRDRFSRVPRVGSASDPVRVICGSSLCEVAAIIEGDATTDKAELDRTYEILGGEIFDDLNKLGVEHITSGYGQTRTHEQSYFAYVRRKA